MTTYLYMLVITNKILNNVFQTSNLNYERLINDLDFRNKTFFLELGSDIKSYTEMDSFHDHEENIRVERSMQDVNRGFELEEEKGLVLPNITKTQNEPKQKQFLLAQKDEDEYEQDFEDDG